MANTNPEILTQTSNTPPTYCIEVRARQAQLRTAEETTYEAAALYFVRGAGLSQADAERLAAEILADPVSEQHTTIPANRPQQGHFIVPGGKHFVDVTLLPGVTDAAANNLVRAAGWIGVTLEAAATGQRYYVGSEAAPDKLDALAAALANPVIQRWTINVPITPPFVPTQPIDRTVEVIPIRALDDMGLQALSAERRLALNAEEMRAIQTCFTGEGRDPTDAEIEMLAQTWSEHCVHKTFKARIDYDGPDGENTINGLLRTYIRAATEQVDKPWVRSAFVDNAGIIAFDDQFDLAFKVETHNHPSALEPFGGANTGVGGVIRDILGVSARPIANTDILCFGPQDLPDAAVPSGVLHPRRVAEGVIRGVEDYGNKMGIPTVNGAIFYHPGYTSNPLVFCGCLGILPRGAHPTQPQPGDLIIVAGGRTGRDGLRGATFSSMAMDQSTGQSAGSSVQIGNPITEKQVQEVVLRARDAGLYNAITDCGAGGLSSAVGEMAKAIGARVQLEQVPLKYPGLRPWEIWLSEAQERMVFAVPPGKWEDFRAVCAGQDVEAVVIGALEPTGRLVLQYDDQMVGDLSMQMLHDGLPQRHLKAVWRPTPAPESVQFAPPADLTGELMALLAHPNIRSRKQVLHRYDHEVGAGSAIKPLGMGDEPNDGAVIVPLDTLLASGGTAQRGVALSVGLAPQLGERDPYSMASAAVDEAFRNLVAIGADPDQVAILDNFCWGNPALPDRLGGLVRCAQGCYDAAVAYNAPFISGKDSLNNEYTDENGVRHAIPGTLAISAVGIVPDIGRAVTTRLKDDGDYLYVVGETRDELGASHYAAMHGDAGGALPTPAVGALSLMRALHRAIRAGMVVACHDGAEGGLAVALAEMCFAGSIGAKVDLKRIPGAADLTRPDAALFAESLGRFVVEVAPGHAPPFEAMMSEAGVPHAQIGTVTYASALQMFWGEQRLIHAENRALYEAWTGITEYASAPETVQERLEFSPARHTLTRAVRQGEKRVLILHANGTNRDRDAALACQLAGGTPEIVHVNQIIAGERRLMDYPMLVLPGGFSYGDDLGAGQLWALILRHRLGEDMARFIDDGRPVLGICNGFQALVKAGFLPGPAFGGNHARPVTLTFNQSGRFECRWVTLDANPASPCLFTAGLREPIWCPVAHGEGRLLAADDAVLAGLRDQNLIALAYWDGLVFDDPHGYPNNPNGSAYNIAGLTNPAGNVLGLMPHPENHILPWQGPDMNVRRWYGLELFRNGVRYA
jgi:phosphoribosylformylglycinamidine synthase